MTLEKPRSARPSVDLDRILKSVDRLRPLPANVTRILRATDDPKATAGVIADLISLDQALTAYILRMANSVSMGYSTPCSSLTDAVMRMGFKQVRALVLSMVTAGPLARRLGGYRLGSGELWQHSLATACLARWLAQALYYNAPEEAYVAGLLHDMGKLLLDQFVMTDYDQIIDLMWKRKLYLWQVEEQLFGIDHAGVGGLMATKWDFPPTLVDAIRCHNSPATATNQPKLAAIVNAANAFTPNDSLGLSSLGGRMIHPDTLRILGLDVPMMEHLRASIPAGLTSESPPPPASHSWLD